MGEYQFNGWQHHSSACKETMPTHAQSGNGTPLFMSACIVMLINISVNSLEVNISYRIVGTLAQLLHRSHLNRSLSQIRRLANHVFISCNNSTG